MDTDRESISKGSEFIYPETIELNDKNKVATLEKNNLNNEKKTLIKTDFEAIYADDTNQYYEYIDEIQVLPVEKEVLEFDRTTNIEVAFQNLDLPKEVIEELRKRQLQLDDGITKEITLFMPRKGITRNEKGAKVISRNLSGELSSPNYVSPKEIVYKLLYNKNPQDYKTNREYVKYTVPNTNISVGF